MAEVRTRQCDATGCTTVGSDVRRLTLTQGNLRSALDLCANHRKPIELVVAEVGGWRGRTAADQMAMALGEEPGTRR